MIVEVRNHIRQQAHIFQRLEAIETMMAYIAHNMDKNGELLVVMKTTMSEVVTTQKLVEKGVFLLRKVEEEKKASQAKAHCLAKEKVVIAAKKEKVEEKTAQLRSEL